MRAGLPSPPWSRTATARSVWTSRRRRSRQWPAGATSPSEIALPLAVFHAGFGDPVVGAGGAALGQPGHRGLGDHLGHRARQRFHAAGAGDVADGAEAHGLLDDLL